MMASVKAEEYNSAILAEEIRDIQSATDPRVGTNIHLFPRAVQADWQEKASDYLRDWYIARPIDQLLRFRNFVACYRSSMSVCFFYLAKLRAARSAQLMMHTDLDCLKTPVREPRAHLPAGDSARHFLERHCHDGLRRVFDFQRVQTLHLDGSCGWDDSHELPCHEADEVLTFPPYLGLIDYHEQHRHAFDLLGLLVARENEIGSPSKGQGKRARERSVEDIVAVWRKAERCVRIGWPWGIATTDPHGRYPAILERSGLVVRSSFERQLQLWTGPRKQRVSETCFVCTMRKQTEGTQ